MKLLVLISAPIKDRAMAEQIADYLKRAGRRFPTELLTLKGERIPSPQAAPRGLKREAERLRKRIPAGYHAVALDVGGRSRSSHDLAQWLDKLAQQGVPGVAFVIGSAYGLCPDWVASANSRLSLSPMTFPHQLVALMVSEQLYRAVSILAGAPYHKH